MSRTRLPGWRLAPESGQQVVSLYEQGYTVPALAIRFGRSQDWVRSQMRQARAGTLSPAPQTVVLEMAHASL